MENDNAIKLVFQAKNEKGDGQELVVERVLKVTSNEQSAGSESPTSVVETARKMLEAALRELDAAGMEMSDENQKVALLKVELAMLTGAKQVTLPAIFKVATAASQQEEA